LTLGAGAQQRSAGGNADPMSDISKEYVRLALAMGEHDKDYVDAYYGPDSLKAGAAQEHRSLDDIGRTAKSLIDRLAATGAPGGDDLAPAPPPDLPQRHR